jgi:ribosomal protein S18 acetylase RimI-like enzyme
LGRALVLRSLAGFREYGAKRVYLEVTAPNLAAVELYRRLGFQHIRTMYRPVLVEGTPF